MSQAAKNSNLFGFLLPIRIEEGSATRLGLQRLLLLRTFVTLSSAFGLLIFNSISSLEIPFQFIILLISGVLLSVLLGYWRLSSTRVVSNPELFGHLLVDVVFLVLLLVNTGGVGNPLISYLLVLLAVSATLLPRVFVYTFAIGSIIIYTSFLLLDLTAEHDMATMGAANDEATFQLHLVGMWVIFLVSAMLITVFITRMAQAIQIREINLAKARENELRNEQLVAIGTLAAGTAHALGTPLSTMSVLLTELDLMDAQALQKSAIKQDISLLKQQVTRCKHSLNQLIRYYNKDSSEQSQSMPLADFINDINDYIINIHPAAIIDFQLDCDGATLVAANLSLRHAVINIVENAIKAAQSEVDVTCSLDSSKPPKLKIAIRDDGPGIPAEVMENVGEPFISMRRDSMGLGIFLANAAVQRLDGTIEMFNLKEGGALTEIRLPLPQPDSGRNKP